MLRRRAAQATPWPMPAGAVLELAHRFPRRQVCSRVVSGVALVTMAARAAHTAQRGYDPRDGAEHLRAQYRAVGPATQRGGGQAGLETYIYSKTAGMIATSLLISSSAAVCLILAILFFKELSSWCSTSVRRLARITVRRLISAGA